MNKFYINELNQFSTVFISININSDLCSLEVMVQYRLKFFSFFDSKWTMQKRTCNNLVVHFSEDWNISFSICNALLRKLQNTQRLSLNTSTKSTIILAWFHIYDKHLSHMQNHFTRDICNCLFHQEWNYLLCIDNWRNCPQM